MNRKDKELQLLVEKPLNALLRSVMLPVSHSSQYVASCIEALLCHITSIDRQYSINIVVLAKIVFAPWKHCYCWMIKKMTWVFTPRDCLYCQKLLLWSFLLLKERHWYTDERETSFQFGCMFWKKPIKAFSVIFSAQVTQLPLRTHRGCLSTSLLLHSSHHRCYSFFSSSFFQVHAWSLRLPSHQCRAPVFGKCVSW